MNEGAKRKRVVVATKREPIQLAYPCTDCKGDAFAGYGPGWGGLIKKGERVCLPCGRKRGVRFF